MNESRLSHDFIYKSTFGRRTNSGHQPKVLRKNWKKIREKIEETASNVLMLSHYYFFCSFCAQKYVHNFCVYIRFFSRKGTEWNVDSTEGWKSTIKKSFSPFSIYSEPPCMYWEILYVIRSVRKKERKKIIVGEGRKKKKRIISYKHEAWKEEGRRKKSSEMWRKMQRGNLSIFFRLQIRLLHHVWKDKKFFLFSCWC